MHNGIPDLLDYVDKKRLQFTVAVDISYIDKEIQTWLFEYIKENGTVKAVQVRIQLCGMYMQVPW